MLLCTFMLKNMHLRCQMDLEIKSILTNLLLNLLFETVYGIKTKPLDLFTDASGCLGF